MGKHANKPSSFFVAKGFECWHVFQVCFSGRYFSFETLVLVLESLEEEEDWLSTLCQ